MSGSGLTLQVFLCTSSQLSLLWVPLLICLLPFKALAKSCFLREAFPVFLSRVARFNRQKIQEASEFEFQINTPILKHYLLSEIHISRCILCFICSSPAPESNLIMAISRPSLGQHMNSKTSSKKIRNIQCFMSIVSPV